jgi:PAS domain S-box-containing protein
MVTDEQGLILWVNPAFTSIAGYTAAQAIGQPASLLDAGRHDQAFQTRFQHELDTHGPGQARLGQGARTGVFT